MRRKQGINIKRKNIQTIELQRYFLSVIRLYLACAYRIKKKYGTNVILYIQKAHCVANIMDDLGLLSRKNAEILNNIIKSAESKEVVTHINKRVGKGIRI